MKTRSFMVIAFIITLVAGAGGLFYRPGTNIAAEEGLTAPEIAGEEPAGSIPAVESAPAVLDALEKVAENEFLALYLSGKTTEVAVLEKKTGKIWYSNPPGREADPVAVGINKIKLGSQLSVTFYTPHAHRRTMDNASECIEYGQYEVEKLPNGVKVTYTIGKKEEIYIIPEKITGERFDKVLEKISASEQRNLKRRYIEIDLNEVEDRRERQQLINEHPALRRHDVVYVLRPNLSLFVLRQLDKIFVEAGYTLEDVNEDHRENEVPEKEIPKDIFTIPLYYTLDGENLVVTIPSNEVVYHSSYPLTEIRVLEFFGAAGPEAEGYIFVPDGSGALIHLNNGKTRHRAYYGPVYGRDYARQYTEIFEEREQVYLPVFGMKQGDQAFFAIIEKGDALATIIADVSGRINSYNTVCAEFSSVAHGTIDLTTLAGNNVIKVYQKRIAQGDFQIRYAFLTGEKADYMGMAEYYRDYLFKKGALKAERTAGAVPFYLELVGGIDRIKPFLGVPARRIEALTTFSEAREVVDRLLAADVNNLKLRYTGWFNGGLRQSLPGKINILKELGGRTGFTRLARYLRANNVEFYPSVTFEYAKKAGILRGFNTRTAASRFINQDVGVLYEINRATYQEDKEKRPQYMVCPSRVGRYVSRFLRRYRALDVKGLSLTTMGRDLNANYREKRLVDRAQAKQYIETELVKMTETGYRLMAEGVNAYALAHTAHIINMPMDSNKYLITDESIPFYQIVTCGHVDYAGEPVNLAGDPRRMFLKTIETGGGLYFTWIYRDNSLIKETDYDHLFSVDYKKWFDQAVAFYHEAREVLEDVRGQRIIDHRRLADDVYKVTFEKGKTIMVNYNRKPVTVEGITLAGESYHVLREGRGDR
ncbi:MAG: hypothetical protein GX085_06335 [Firmicutes bacterium]|nr:hypothetical protein [Bacillota bacterium]